MLYEVITKAISRLTEFEWFHKIETENDLVTPEIDDLLLEAQKAYQSIDDVVKGLGIRITSYNVCYTKLLRILYGWLESMKVQRVYKKQKIMD